MKKVKCFIREESAVHPGKYIIRPVHDNFHLYSTEGSFCVIGARVMGLTYSQYLRMCRDVYKAEIIGKNSYYPVAYFKLSKELDDLLEQLNARANFILWERNNPNYKEHEQFVKTKNPKFYEKLVK